MSRAPAPAPEAELENRVLVLARHGRDAELTVRLLESQGHACAPCADLDALCDELERGAGTAIITVESMRLGAPRDRLRRLLAEQPPWSDFPVVVMTAGGSGEPSFDWLGKVLVLPRPVSPRSLLTTVRTALRARARQYEARTAIEQRDQFLAMLGHELRNPLAAILLASEMGGASTEPAVLHRRLAIVERHARHLSRLVDDLLDVARVTAGKVVLQRETVDLREIVQGAVASLATLAKERRVEISVAAAGPARVDADPLRLAQIVDNLLTNAVKYSRVGGHVDVTIRADAGGSALHVRDDGIGIAPDMLPRIFDLFAQADGALDRANGGMGIGLTLVRRLVELHEGSVEVTSPGLGRGAEFIVHLPAPAPVMSGAAADAHHATPARGQPRAVRVVIVDDNDDLRELGKELLEQLGCVVESASDGPSGLDRILAAAPDIAFVDIGLPGMNGFAVAEGVRARLGAAPMLVAMTGYGQAQDRARSLGAGFDRHLTKPVRAAAFGEIVAAARARAA